MVARMRLKSWRRVARRAAAAIAAGSFLVLLLASPAFAHASLLQSDPAPGAVLQQAPKVITLSFSEPVDASFGAVRVYDSDSARLDRGGVETSNNVVKLRLPDLDDGSYVVTWRVTSADSHPVSGAFTFQVGSAGNANSPKVQNLAQRLLSQEGGDRVVGAVYGATRWLLFAGLALLIGGAAFGVLVWPPARASARTRRWVWGGWTATMVASIAGFLAYGPYAAGLGPGEAFRSTLLDETLNTRLGEIVVVRVALLLLAIPVLRALFARDGAAPRRVAWWWLGSGAALAVLLAASPGLAGHASTGDWVPVAVGTDAIHVLSMAVWLGGIVVLASVLLPGRTVAELDHSLPRWSRVALVCVGAIVATGAFQTWRQVRSLEALRATESGRMLIVKLVLFAVILVLAAFSRELVLRLFPPPELVERHGVPVIAGGSDDDPEPEISAEEWADYERHELGNLRRSVWAEVLVAVAVLAVTALLVNAPPAKNALAQPGTVGAIGVTMKSDKVWVDVTMVPGRRGANQLHVSTFTPQGRPKQVEEVTVTLSLPDRKIASIDVPLQLLSDGHYLAAGFNVPIAGTWRVTAKVVVSEFVELTLRGELEVGGS
jgi:copper transport protein